jgi:hypothetical protein
METSEARIAKDRVRNATRALRTESPDLAQIGTQGALVYALLDVANAIRHAHDEDQERLLRLTDLMADAIADGDMERAERLAASYKIERDGPNYDQLHG